MSRSRKQFQLTDAEINRILFCDESDTEDALVLDDEDIDFLEDDVTQMEESSNTEDIMVVIDPPNDAMVPVDDIGESSAGVHVPQSSEVPTRYAWKTVTSENAQAFVSETGASFEYEKVLITTSDDPNPYEIFEKVARFDYFLSDIVIPQTTLYSQQKGHVFSVEIEELRAYFGMNLVMGYHVLPSMRDYWSCEPDLCVPFIANVMPRRRFEEIRSLLHFSNNESMKAQNDPLHDRAFKVRPVIDHFNESFASAMAPSEFQSIDEHMIKFKGHNIIRQYVKGKPIKWGFKMWCRCASKSGYLFECDLYTGKKYGLVQYGLGEAVVLQLTEKIRDIGCHIFIDNFFNSPALQVQLFQRKIFSAGTVRANRKNLPKANVPSDKNMKRGDVACFTSNGIFYVKWMDNRAVHMTSNYLSAFPTSDVKRRKKGSSEKETFNCPAVVKQYNEYMGGVDIMDQKKVTYQFDHRSNIKYYLRVVSDLIDIAVNNAFIIFSKFAQTNSANIEHIDSKTFRRIVARRLIGNYCNRSRAGPSTPKAYSQRKRKYSSSTDNTTHSMEKVEQRQRCKLCTTKKVQNRTNNMCVDCGIYLCYVNGRNCFEKYHAEM